MKPSAACINLIKQFEGFYAAAYLDPVQIPTIGYGTIQYPNGSKVKLGDTCTPDQAEQYLQFEVEQKAKTVESLLKQTPINQGQFDALVSFAYNLGTGALKGSTLLKKVLQNPHDNTIYAYDMQAGKPVIDSCEFLRWVRAGGKVLNGLVKRRAAEADMYKGE